MANKHGGHRCAAHGVSQTHRKGAFRKRRKILRNDNKDTKNTPRWPKMLGISLLKLDCHKKMGKMLGSSQIRNLPNLNWMEMIHFSVFSTVGNHWILGAPNSWGWMHLWCVASSKDRQKTIESPEVWRLQEMRQRLEESGLTFKVCESRI